MWCAERRRVLHAGCAARLALLAGPTLAQRPPGVGVLYPGPEEGSADRAGALGQLRDGLRERGLLQGRTVELLVRFVAFQPGRAAELTAEMQRAGVVLIVAGTGPAAASAQRAAPGLPIVFAVSADPVADGLVASLAHSGGNVAGLSVMNPELTPRRLQLLADLVPGLRRVSLLLDDGFPRWRAEQREHEAAAERLGRQLLHLMVPGPPDFRAAFATARREGAQASPAVGAFDDTFQAPPRGTQRGRTAPAGHPQQLPRQPSPRCSKDSSRSA